MKEMISATTQRASNLSVDKELRYKQILSILNKSPQGLTAKEIAVIMCQNQLIPTSERNYTAPRLTELSIENKVKVIGKRKCDFSNKQVSVYIAI